MAGRLAGVRSILVDPIHPEEEPWWTRMKRWPERVLLARTSVGRHDSPCKPDENRGRYQFGEARDLVALGHSDLPPSRIVVCAICVGYTSKRGFASPISPTTGTSENANAKLARFYAAAGRMPRRRLSVSVRPRRCSGPNAARLFSTAFAPRSEGSMTSPWTIWRRCATVRWPTRRSAKRSTTSSASLCWTRAKRCRWRTGRANSKRPAATFRSSCSIIRSIRWPPARNRCLANLLIERGQILTEQARQPEKSAEERDRLLDQARELLPGCAEGVRRSSTPSSTRLRRRLERLDPNDAETIQRRNQVRSEIILTRLALAKMLYEIAFTYEPDSYRREGFSSGRRRPSSTSTTESTNNGSAAAFSALKRPAATRKLGDYAKATAILDELAALRSSDDEGFRHIRTAATELALQTYLLPQVKKYKEAWAVLRKVGEQRRAAGRAGQRSDGRQVSRRPGRVGARPIARQERRRPGEARAEYLKTRQGLAVVGGKFSRRVSAEGPAAVCRSAVDRRPGACRNAEGFRRRLRPRQARLGAAARRRLETRTGRAVAGRGAGVLPFRLGARAAAT